jgi:hypothetical protein
MMSTRGSGAFSGTLNRGRVDPTTGSTNLTVAASTKPAGPAFGETNVCRLVVLVLVASRDSWMVSLRTISTPRPWASFEAATFTAPCRLAGPSALIAVEGRMDPTSTTGLSLATTCSRKNAVSSIVSVPCVITTASASPLPNSALIRCASLTQTSSFMSWLPMFEICSAVSFASFSIPGTASIRSCAVTCPEV